MSDLPELEAIREREKATPPGPWGLITDSCDCGDGYGCPHGSWPHGFRLTVPRQVEVRGKIIPTEDWHYEYTEFADLPMEAAEFMAAAREDVPHLLGIVDRLLALAAEWEAKAKEIGDSLTYRDTEGAVAGFKMIGHQNHRNHAEAIRAAVRGEPAEAAERRTAKAGATA
jgi:hypothetical protein